MPEFMFDPAAGEAVEVSRGGQQELQPEGPTPAELTRYRLSESAQGLASRQNNKHALGEATDLSEQELEISLQQLQQKLYRGGLNPLEEQQCIQQAEYLAAELAGGTAPKSAEPTPNEEPEDFNQAYKNANPGVDQDLAFAAEVMGTELATEFNSLISSDDELTRVAALDTLHNLRESPQSFISKEHSTGVDEFTRSSIAEQVGEELAKDIQTLGNAVAQGVISPSQAIATAAKDPSLQQALISCARAGLIKIAL